MRPCALFASTALLVTLAGAPAPAWAMHALAHRGADNARVDENTIDALERAHRLSAWSEADTFLTSDGVPVVIHDARLDRTTDCTGAVADWTAAEIRGECRTEHGDVVPTWREYARTLADNRGQRVNLEVKGRGWFADGAAEIVALRDIAERADVLRRVYFSEDATLDLLEAFRDHAPDARTAWKPASGDVDLGDARRLSVDAIMAPPGYWTAGRVEATADAGFRPWARKVNTEGAWDRMRDMGVRAALTDHPGWELARR
jgi:glycerophosphoryl diester phosphodiesterase